MAKQASEVGPAKNRGFDYFLDRLDVELRDERLRDSAAETFEGIEGVMGHGLGGGAWLLFMFGFIAGMDFLEVKDGG